MTTAISFLRSLVRLLLFLILLPFLLLRLFLRYRLYKAALIRGLEQAGMPKASAKDLAGSMKPTDWFR